MLVGGDAVDADVHAADRYVPQPLRRRPHLFRRLVADRLDQFRQRHRGHQVVVAEAAPVAQCDDVFARQHLHDVGIQLDLALDVRQEPVHQRLEAALQRIAEAGVRAQRFRRRFQRALDDFFQVRQRHAAAQPRRLHLGQRHGPDLAVIRDGEMLRDALAPDFINELLEVPDRALDGAIGIAHVRRAVGAAIVDGLRGGRGRFRAFVAGFDGAHDALRDDLRRQAIQRALVENVEMPLARIRPRVDELLRIDAGGRRAGDIADIVGAGAARAEAEFHDAVDHLDGVLRLDLADLQIGAGGDVTIRPGAAVGEIGEARELPVLHDAVRNAQPAHIGRLRWRHVEQPVIAPAEIVGA